MKRRRVWQDHCAVLRLQRTHCRQSSKKCIQYLCWQQQQPKSTTAGQRVRTGDRIVIALLLLDSCYISSIMLIQPCPIKVPRQEPRSVATTSLAASMSLSMPAFIACTSNHLGDTAGSVLLFRAFTLRALITRASSYPHIVPTIAPHAGIVLSLCGHHRYLRPMTPHFFTRGGASAAIRLSC